MRFKKTLTTLLVTGALAVVVLFPTSRIKTGHKPTCKTNLYSLTMGFDLYNYEFKEYPNKLSNLYPDFVHDEKCFICPSSRDKIKYFGNESIEEIEKTRKSIDLNTSYVYFKPNGNTKPNDIILSDRGPNHEDGIWVSNLRGRVYWIDEKEEKK